MNAAKMVKQIEFMRDQSRDPEVTAILEVAIDKLGSFIEYHHASKKPCCSKGECLHGDIHGDEWSEDPAGPEFDTSVSAIDLAREAAANGDADAAAFLKEVAGED